MIYSDFGRTRRQYARLNKHLTAEQIDESVAELIFERRRRSFVRAIFSGERRGRGFGWERVQRDPLKKDGREMLHLCYWQGAQVGHVEVWAEERVYSYFLGTRIGAGRDASLAFREVEFRVLRAMTERVLFDEFGRLRRWRLLWLFLRGE